MLKPQRKNTALAIKAQFFGCSELTEREITIRAFKVFHNDCYHLAEKYCPKGI